jgi:hypothetical protein
MYSPGHGKRTHECITISRREEEEEKKKTAKKRRFRRKLGKFLTVDPLRFDRIEESFKRNFRVFFFFFILFLLTAIRFVGAVDAVHHLIAPLVRRETVSLVEDVTAAREGPGRAIWWSF